MKEVMKRVIAILSLLGVVGTILYFVFIFPFQKKDNSPSDTSTSAIVQMQGQINKLNENIDNMMIVLSDKEMTIQIMSVDLADAYDEIDSQKRAMNILCDEIDAKNAKIEELGEENTELKEKLKAEIQDLKNKYSEIETKVSELEDKVLKTETDIETIKEDIAIIKVNIENIQEQIEGLQTSIDNLTSKVLTVTYQWISGTQGVLIYSNGVMETWGKIVQWFNDNQVYYFSLPDNATYGNTIWNISISVYGVEECSTLNVEITGNNQFYLQNQRYANVNDHMGVYYRTIGIKT